MNPIQYIQNICYDIKHIAIWTTDFITVHAQQILAINMKNLSRLLANFDGEMEL